MNDEKLCPTCQGVLGKSSVAQKKCAGCGARFEDLAKQESSITDWVKTLLASNMLPKELDFRHPVAKTAEEAEAVLKTGSGVGLDLRTKKVIEGLPVANIDGKSVPYVAPKESPEWGVKPEELRVVIAKKRQEFEKVLGDNPWPYVDPPFILHTGKPQLSPEARTELVKSYQVLKEMAKDMPVPAILPPGDTLCGVKDDQGRECIRSKQHPEHCRTLGHYFSKRLVLCQSRWRNSECIREKGHTGDCHRLPVVASNSEWTAYGTGSGRFSCEQENLSNAPRKMTLDPFVDQLDRIQEAARQHCLYVSGPLFKEGWLVMPPLRHFLTEELAHWAEEQLRLKRTVSDGHQEGFYYTFVRGYLDARVETDREHQLCFKKDPNRDMVCCRQEGHGGECDYLFIERPELIPHGTVTGRLSASEPARQRLPKPEKLLQDVNLADVETQMVEAVIRELQLCGKKEGTFRCVNPKEHKGDCLPQSAPAIIAIPQCAGDTKCSKLATAMRTLYAPDIGEPKAYFFCLGHVIEQDQASMKCQRPELAGKRDAKEVPDWSVPTRRSWVQRLCMYQKLCGQEDNGLWCVKQQGHHHLVSDKSHLFESFGLIYRRFSKASFTPEKRKALGEKLDEKWAKGLDSLDFSKLELRVLAHLPPESGLHLNKHGVLSLLEESYRRWIAKNQDKRVAGYVPVPALASLDLSPTTFDDVQRLLKKGELTLQELNDLCGRLWDDDAAKRAEAEDDALKARGWEHFGSPMEIQALDISERFEGPDRDQQAIEAHRKECGCPWPETDYQDAIMSWLEGIREDPNPTVQRLLSIFRNQAGMRSLYPGVVPALIERAGALLKLMPPEGSNHGYIDGALKVLRIIEKQQKEGNLNPHQFSTQAGWTTCKGEGCEFQLPPGTVNALDGLCPKCYGQKRQNEPVPEDLPHQRLERIAYWYTWFSNRGYIDEMTGATVAGLLGAMAKGTLIEVDETDDIIEMMTNGGVDPKDPVWRFIRVVKDRTP